MEENTVYPPELFAGKDYNNASGGNKLITDTKTQRILKKNW